MSQQRLHQYIGDYMREIEKIQQKATKNNKPLSASQILRVRSWRKKIVEAAKILQKGW